MADKIINGSLKLTTLVTSSNVSISTSNIATVNGDVSTVRDMISDEYDNTSTYNLDDIVIYTGALYRCTTAITTPEDWNSSHWTQTNIATELSNSGGGGETEIVDNFDSQLELNNEANLTVYRREFRVSKKGNRVCLWIYYSARNESGSSINGINIKQKAFEVSSAIAGSLKDMFGNLVSTSDNNKQISTIIQNIYNDGNVQTQPMRFYHAGTNKVGLYNGSNVSVPNDGNFIIKVYTEFVI